CGLGGVPESDSGGRSCPLEIGPQVRVKLLAADDRGTVADGRALPGGLGEPAARRLAAALWGGGDQRGRLFGAGCPGDGDLLHAVRRIRPVFAGSLGQRIYGGGIRRTPYSLRTGDRQEAWWLSRTPFQNRKRRDRLGSQGRRPP